MNVLFECLTLLYFGPFNSHLCAYLFTEGCDTRKNGRRNTVPFNNIIKLNSTAFYVIFADAKELNNVLL